MIEIKLKNPDTGQFEECSVSTLTTPRLINGVEFDGSKDIDINEKEVIISNDTPTDEKNKLWISGTQGVPSSPITVDWDNVNNKPTWSTYIPSDALIGNEKKVLSVKADASGYEYVQMSSKLQTTNLLVYGNTLDSGTITNIP